MYDVDYTACRRLKDRLDSPIGSPDWLAARSLPLDAWGGADGCVQRAPERARNRSWLKSLNIGVV